MTGNDRPAAVPPTGGGHRAARWVGRTSWLLAAGAAGVLGTAVAAVSLDAAGLSGALVGLAFLGAAAWAQQDDSPTLSQAERSQRAAAAGLATALVGAAAVGLVALAGPVVVAPLLVLLATSPPARRRWSTRADPVVVPTPAGAPVSAPPPADTMDDDALCRAWRSSFTALQEVRDAAGRAELAERRAGYLAELSRRHPAGVERWLASGARAAGDPRPFLTRPTPVAPRRAPSPLPRRPL